MASSLFSTHTYLDVFSTNPAIGSPEAAMIRFAYAISPYEAAWGEENTATG